MHGVCVPTCQDIANLRLFGKSFTEIFTGKYNVQRPCKGVGFFLGRHY